MTRNYPLAFRFASSLLMILCINFNSLFAITIRHDVPDADYIALSQDYRYEAAALLNLGNTCAVAGGVLVHPEWALTAAHCTPTNLNQTVNFNLGADQNNLDLTVSADNWFRHTSYANNVATGFDFGLVHLTEPVLDVTPVRLYRGASEAQQTTTVVGYGRTGTGQTGDTMARGTRRAGQFNIDAYGTVVGVSNKIAIGDFDNPNVPGQSSTGPNTALPLEAGIAFNDSGSPWFIEVAGLTYAAAITSFRADTDGNSNSDYGDIGGGTRISREINWIEANHDLTVFWNGTTGDWTSDFRWVTHPQPTADQAAVIDGGEAMVTAAATANYVFVDGSGKLSIGAALTTDNIIVNRQGTLSPMGAATLNNDVEIKSGTLEFELGTSDSFTVNGTFEAAGELSIVSGAYTDPTARGTVEELTLLVATDLQGSFDSVTFDDTAETMPATYVGLSSNGDDGLFRSVSVDESNSNEIVLTNYLALGGDANGDQVVDGLDFILWNDNKFETGKDWTTGDFNGDGIADGLDFIIWNENKFTSVGTAAPLTVPEPSSIAILFAAAALAVARRR